MSVLSPEVEAAILETATMVHQCVAEDKGIGITEVASLGICRKMTISFMSTLLEFYDIDDLDVDTRLAWTGDTHSYPVICEDDQEIIVEGAWLQSVPEKLRNSDLPLILIGTRPHIVRAATRAGVWECDREIWYPRSMYTDPQIAISHHPSSSSNKVINAAA